MSHIFRYTQDKFDYLMLPRIFTIASHTYEIWQQLQHFYNTPCGINLLLASLFSFVADYFEKKDSLFLNGPFMFTVIKFWQYILEIYQNLHMGLYHSLE